MNADELPFVDVGPQDWGGRPVFIIGGGSSLTGVDLRPLEDHGRLVGVNVGAFTGRHTPTEVMFSLDHGFIRGVRYGDAIKAYVECGGEVWFAAAPNFRRPLFSGVNYVQRRQGIGLSFNPREIFGKNSGFGAINLAVLRGATDIYILGFDMRASTRAHWHDEYGRRDPERVTRSYRMWLRDYDHVPAQLESRGIRVTNVVGPLGSAIEAFPTTPLESWLVERAA